MYGETIDSRDILGELRELLQEPSYDYNDEPAEVVAEETWTELDQEDRERVQTLRELLQELPEETVDGRNSYGCTLIREDYFETYARELAEDIGAIDRDASWPMNHIDWPAAADALKVDYTEVELDGETYFAR